MFSQKKSFWKGKIFFLLLAGLLVGGYWINKGGADAPKEETNLGTELSSHGQAVTPSREADNPQPVERPSHRPSVIDSGDIADQSGADHKSVGDQENGAAFSPERAAQRLPENGTDFSPPNTGLRSPENSRDSSANGETSREEKPYYLVRNDDGIIKIYYCEEGKPDQFIRATEINYSLLSESDQKMFEKGVIRKTKDGLSELLQDFES